jgi:hypothetical protein
MEIEKQEIKISKDDDVIYETHLTLPSVKSCEIVVNTLNVDEEYNSEIKRNIACEGTRLIMYVYYIKFIIKYICI